MINSRIDLRRLIRTAAHRQEISNHKFNDHDDHILDGLKSAGYGRVNTLNYSDNLLLPDCVAHNNEHADELNSKAYIVLKDVFGIEIKYGLKLNELQRKEANNYLDCAVWLLDNRDNFKGQVIGKFGIYSYGDYGSILNQHGYIDKVILTKGTPLTTFSASERKSLARADVFIGGMDIGDTVKWFSQFVNPSQLHVISDLNINSPGMTGGSLIQPTFAHTSYGGVKVASHRKAGQVFEYVNTYK
jgi:hypothetical protein